MGAKEVKVLNVRLDEVVAANKQDGE